MRTEPPATPRHVAIIMDGNGRWARARGLPRTFGHKKGAEAVRRVVEAAPDLGIRYLTLFGFSSENWSRPLAEVETLMGLLRTYLLKELAELHQNDVRLRVIGDRSTLARDIVDLIQQAERLTEGNTRLTLTIALSYGARNEIAGAARRLASMVAEGALSAADITPERLEGEMMTAGIPDPDLVIRTSGEQRISNFLLWQAAYAELLFVDEMWPDFNGDSLAAAVAVFGKRERRFGALAGGG